MTLKELKDFGVLELMVNGFDIYDADIECDYDDLKLTHPIFGAKFFMDCPVKFISANDSCGLDIPTFYISTKEIREKNKISDDEFIRIIKEEYEKAEELLINENFDILKYINSNLYNLYDINDKYLNLFNNTQ